MFAPAAFEPDHIDPDWDTWANISDKTEQSSKNKCILLFVWVGENQTNISFVKYWIQLLKALMHNPSIIACLIWSDNTVSFVALDNLT